MRVSVDHRTRYRFTRAQDRLIQLLRLTPQDSADQTVVNWHIGVDCDARLRESRDGFGNRVTMLYAEGPIDGIEITVQGEVLTAGDVGLVRGVLEPLPVALFGRATDRTLASRAMRAFATEVDAGRDRIARLHALNTALHARFRVREEASDTGVDAGAAFQADTASPRDFAHLLIALARAEGIPARYVSGYHTRDDGHAPHAWAEAHVDDLGWVAFDPSRGVSADASYVRVAVALDAGGAAPVAGMRIGEGSERLDVDVQVEDLGGDAE